MNQDEYRFIHQLLEREGSLRFNRHSIEINERMELCFKNLQRNNLFLPIPVFKFH